MFTIIFSVLAYKLLVDANEGKEIKANGLVIIAPMICDLILANIIFN